MKSRQNIIYIAVFTATILGLYLLLVLSATVPNGAIQKNMRRSVQQYANADRYAFTEDGLFQNVADNYADQMWLNIGWHMSTGNPFVAALDTKYYDGMEYGTAAGLLLTVTRGNPANASYTRYWHGTAGLLRIFHLFTDIRGIKTIGMVCLILLVMNTLSCLLREGHGDLGICLLLSLLAVHGWNLRLSVEYLPCFLICFCLCPVFLRWEKNHGDRLGILSVISGTVTAFFDFLTTETVTILVPLILVTAIRSKERRLGSPRKVAKDLLHWGLCWLTAYGGTFAVKWALVSIVTRQNHFLSALDSVAKRINGTVAVEQLRETPGFFMGIAANLSVLFNGDNRTEYARIICLLILAAAFLIFLYRQNLLRKKLCPGSVFLLLLGSVVFLRYGILANHSYMHAFFTYRALVSFILALLAVTVINLRSAGGKGAAKWK